MKTILLQISILLSVFFTSCTNTYRVETSNLALTLSEDATITSLYVGNEKTEKKVSLYTSLEGCKQQGKASIEKQEDGTIICERVFICDSLQTSCQVVDRFTPTTNSIRWTVEIKGNGRPWGTNIQTQIHYPIRHDTTLFWTSWGAPQFDPATINPSTQQRLKAYKGGGTAQQSFLNEKTNNWTDPLVPVPFSDVTYYYGAPYFQYEKEKQKIGFVPAIGNLFCIPMATIIEPQRQTGITFGLSPDDEIIDMTMCTTENGSIIFNRLFNRISEDHICSFTLDITTHADDWRPALAWMRDRYPHYFHPVNPAAHKFGGTGAYSNHFDNFDVDKMKKMCFTVNWQASFDFPYMGMFLPPVKGDERWERFDGGTISVKAMNDYAKKMRELGFYVFNYFNVTEFGSFVKYPPPPHQTTDEKELWKNANDFLYTQFAGAILPKPDACVSRAELKGAKPPEPWFTWAEGIAMDCAEETYRAFLLDQARRHVKEIPESYGICIDRLDWLRLFNERADDGITWFEGKPVRSLITSWKQLAKDLGPVFHDAGKSILANNHVKRIDFLEHIDGLFDEFTYAGSPLNTTALLCINKPALGWTDDAQTVKTEGGDVFFQKYLYLGVFPMCPFPGNDHSIHPDPVVDRIYLDYGPLMQLMKNKQWELTAHAVTVKEDAAKANIFKTPDGYTIPVVYGNSDYVEIQIRHLDDIHSLTSCNIYHPGKDAPIKKDITFNGDHITIEVPLHRNCAMLEIK